MRVFIETSCLYPRNTGISNSIQKFICCLKDVGVTVIELSPPSNISRKGYFFKLIYYNDYLRKYCLTHLKGDDIFLIPNNLGHFIRMPYKNTWLLVHDLIPLSPNVGYSGFKRVLYKWKVGRMRKASHIITISEYVKKQLIDVLKISATKIDVLYWTYDLVFELEGKKSSNYFLSVGSGEPRKNVQFLIENWEKIYENKYHLILFGEEWRKGIHAELIKLIPHQVRGYIHFRGKVSNEELINLYKNSLGFIFPSIEEGFGLPPLEALACGTSVILPKTPINYELYSQIAYMYSLGNVEELYAAIKCVLAEEIDVIKQIAFCDKHSLSVFRKRILEIFRL